jgi:tetratricopeptide (TPR) repeat protein
MDLAELLKAPDNGRLSMIYYGLVNCYVIRAAQEKPKAKRATLIRALLMCDDCIKLLTDKDPLMAKMWMLRGLVCMDAGEMAPAKQSFLKAHDEWKQPEATVNLSEILLKEGKYQQVIEILMPLYNLHGVYPIKGLSFDPVQLHYITLEKLGNAYAHIYKDQSAKNPGGPSEEMLESLNKAEKYYREALTFKPRVNVAAALLQILYTTNRWDELAVMARGSVNMWPGFFYGWNYLGEYETLNKFYTTAIVFFREALKLKPDFKEAQHNLNECLKIVPRMKRR